MPRAPARQPADLNRSPHHATTVTVACVRLGLTPEHQRRCARLLPVAMRATLERYVRSRDREAYLLGRLALLDLLRERGHGDDCLHRLDYAERGKPCFPGAELNISHSGDYVLCAVGDGGPLGIDVERVRPLDVSELERFFSPSQWRSILAAADPRRQFFVLWTQLESVLKADGGGLSTAAAEISLEPTGARLRGTLWHLHPLAVDPSHVAHLATGDPRARLELRRLPAAAVLPASLEAQAVEH